MTAQRCRERCYALLAASEDDAAKLPSGGFDAVTEDRFRVLTTPASAAASAANLAGHHGGSNATHLPVARQYGPAKCKRRLRANAEQAREGLLRVVGPDEHVVREASATTVADRVLKAEAAGGSPEQVSAVVVRKRKPPPASCAQPPEDAAALSLRLGAAQQACVHLHRQPLHACCVVVALCPGPCDPRPPPCPTASIFAHVEN